MISSPDSRDDAHAGSSERFGYSWERFSTPTAAQEEQFRRWTSLLDPLTGWMGKRVIDVGCGAGRNSRWAMKYGAASVLAIDLDEKSLTAARRNLADFPAAQVESKSVYQLGQDREFDLAFSLGVIHHLPDPAGAIRCMASVVKPGGQVLIWVYGYENMRLFVHVLNPLRTLLFSRLPIGFVRFLALLLTPFLWLGLRVFSLRLEYFRLLRTFSFAHLRHIILDQMLPRIAHYYRREEVEALMVQAELGDIQLAQVNGMSWCALGTVLK